jgi:cell division initiation protein
MKLTPLDIQQQQFKSALLGFDKKEVDAFLDVVAHELERHVRDGNQLREEAKRKDAELLQYQERERTLKETLITATRISEDIKENARKEAEIVVAQAEAQAEQIIQNAHTRLVRVMEDIDELRRQKVQFEASLRSSIHSHGKLLDAMSDKDAGLEAILSVDKRRRPKGGDEDDARRDDEAKVVGMRESGGLTVVDDLMVPRGGDR